MNLCGVGLCLSHPPCYDGDPMKTIVQLDHQTILANLAQPVHLALQFSAPSLAGHREHPTAFSIVIDRSGSMAGYPLQAAITAAKAVVRNLRSEDLFSLVTFDDNARQVVPMGLITSKSRVCDLIERITSGGSTNLTGGWMMGCDAMKSTPAGTVRRQLLLTDGQLNVGIVDPVQVKQIVANGLEQHSIRTSTLGFGVEYDEDLLSDLAKATGGTFYDANKADKLPEIFRSELDGLQQITVQNLRLRIKSLDFVDAVNSLGCCPELKLPDGRLEYAVGDLMADEERVTVFALSVLPMPLLAGTQTPAASLEGEALVELEIIYDGISTSGVTSHTERHTIRVRATQSPEDIQVNEVVLPWVSTQQAAEILGQALTRRDAGDLPGAMEILQAGINRLKAYARDAQIADALQLLETSLAEMADFIEYRKVRKGMRFKAASYAKMSSTDMWVNESGIPTFKKPRKQPPPPVQSDNTPTPPASQSAPPPGESTPPPADPPPQT